MQQKQLKTQTPPPPPHSGQDAQLCLVTDGSERPDLCSPLNVPSELDREVWSMTHGFFDIMGEQMAPGCMMMGRRGKSDHQCDALTDDLMGNLRSCVHMATDSISRSHTHWKHWKH